MLRKKARARESRGNAGPLRPDSGVSLAEMMVSLVIFSTALLGIVGTAARVGASVNSSHMRLGAASVARQQIETLLTQPYDSVASGSAERKGVKMVWAVTEGTAGKNVVLVYQYRVPQRAYQDTLTIGVLKP